MIAVVEITEAGSTSLSINTPNHGFIISSQVCVPPNSSAVGSGFPRFPAELAKWASTRSWVPVGNLVDDATV